MTTTVELATFGAGCFWGVEAAFRKLDGIIDTSVGYMGGHFENPCYLDVSRWTLINGFCHVERSEAKSRHLGR